MTKKREKQSELFEKNEQPLKQRARRIVQLYIENVKRIVAVDLVPDPESPLVVIGGNNGAGKSSILDSIAYALGGQKLCPELPIRTGAEDGVVSVNLGDIIVTRTFTEKGSYLTVRNPEGATFMSPQALLDKMATKLTFDPLTFARGDGKTLAATLRDVLGIDFSELDKERSEVYEHRRQVNARAKDLGAQERGIEVPQAAEEEKTPEELMVIRKKLEAERAKNNELRSQLRSAEGTLRAAEARVTGTEEIIQDLEDRLETTRNALDAEVKDAVEWKKKVAAETKAVEKLEDPDLEEIDRRILAASKAAESVRVAKLKEQLKEQRLDLEREAEVLSERLLEIDTEKAEQLSEAKMPIDGLELIEDTVYLNGVPFEQASDAERLVVATALGLSAHPELRVILIRDGSLLDENSLAAVAKVATDHDAQVWIERVGEGKEVSVVIEEGQVKHEGSSG